MELVRRAPREAHGLVLGLALCLGAGVGATVGLAPLLSFAFPVAAVLLGGRLLLTQRSTAYVELVLWLWLLTPWVRRMVDLGSGWHPVSPVMLAAPAATLLCLLPAVLGRRRPEPRTTAALLVGLVAVGYGCLTGALQSGPAVALGAVATWLPPLALGLYVATGGPAYPDLVAVLRRTAVLGCALLGAYGVYQFFAPPAWDVFWMLNAPINSIGYPFPFEVRVFSTLNSSAPFGVVIGTLLVLLTGTTSRGRAPAALLGVASLGLSLVRTAWLGYAVSLLLLASPRRGRLAVSGVLVVLLPLALVLVIGGPVRETIVDRFSDTAQAGQEDTSLSDRVASHEQLIPVVLRDPVGSGLGSLGVATKLGNAAGALGAEVSIDGGALELLFTYGALVGLLVLGSTLVAVVAAVRISRPRGDFERAMAAALVGLTVQLLLYQPLATPTGILFYLLLAVLGRAATEDDARAEGPDAASAALTAAPHADPAAPAPAV